MCGPIPVAFVGLPPFTKFQFNPPPTLLELLPSKTTDDPAQIVVEFVIKLTQDNPEPMTLTKLENGALLLSLSYIITYILI